MCLLSLEIEEEKVREKYECEREISIDSLLYATQTGIEPTNLGICLDLELNTNLLVYRMALQPTKPHQPGLFYF